MQWYKFTIEREAFFQKGSKPFISFLEIIKDSSIKDSWRGTILMLWHTRDDEFIYFFTSKFPKILRLFVKQFNCQPCEELPKKKRVGDSPMRYIWGDSSLWTSESRK